MGSLQCFQTVRRVGSSIGSESVPVRHCVASVCHVSRLSCDDRHVGNERLSREESRTHCCFYRKLNKIAFQSKTNNNRRMMP